MARKGIYVNNKEIVARYIGDKLVWEKQKLIEVAHFQNFYDWESYGDIILRRILKVSKSYGDTQDTQQSSYDYNASKAKINGKMYNIQGAQMTVSDLGDKWEYMFMILFKDRINRDEVSRMYQKDIYLYRRG